MKNLVIILVLALVVSAPLLYAGGVAEAEPQEFTFLRETFRPFNHAELAGFLKTDGGRHQFAVIMTIELLNNDELGFRDLYAADLFPEILVYSGADGLTGVVSYGFLAAETRFTACYDPAADEEIRVSKERFLASLDAPPTADEQAGTAYPVVSRDVAQMVVLLLKRIRELD